MQKQTFISFLENEKGQMVTFERWPYKKLETVLKHVKALYATLDPKRIDKRINTISVYATPDGYNKEKTPVFTMDITDFLR